MNESTRPSPITIANCLYRCTHIDVCRDCIYLDVPNGYKGECINRMMDDAAETLRYQRKRILELQALHKSLKKTNKELKKENRALMLENEALKGNKENDL